MKKAEFLEKFTAACQAYDAKKYKEAFKLFKLLAEENEPVSQYRVGIFYLLGQSVKQNDGQAFEWFRKSTESDYPPALTIAGEMLLADEEIEQDIPHGIANLMLAAGFGFGQAQALTCLAYDQHLEDAANAYFWALISGNNPSQDAELNQLVEKTRVGVQAKLTPEQIQAAKDKAANWHPNTWQPPEDLFED